MTAWPNVAAIACVSTPDGWWPTSGCIRWPADGPARERADRTGQRVGDGMAADAPRPQGRRCAHPPGRAGARDRKSTRLNSSHVKISYAVFCLKKKKTK